MASSLAPKIVAFLADAAITKGMAVKIGSNDQHVAKSAANTDSSVGLAQVSVTTAEDTVEVAIGGGAKGLLGESVVAGKLLVAHTDGTLVKANASGDKIIAMAMEGGASGDLIDVVVVPSMAAAAE